MTLDLVRRLAADRRAVSAVEFALIAPVMILLYFGLVVLTGAMMAESKASHTTSAIGDLVSQATSIHDSDMADIWTVANTVMSPFDTSVDALQMRVTNVVEDANGNITVGWCDVQGGMTQYTVGSPYTGLPAGLITANQTIIVSEVTYHYTAPLNVVANWIPNLLTFKEIFYLKPRQGDSVNRIHP